ncbi:MAG: protein kinase domain-containing protein [Gemmatimonadota bacterium]
MTTPRVQRLFAEILELPAEARDAFLERKCADDPRLAEQLRDLLIAHDSAESSPDFLAELDVDGATALLRATGRNLGFVDVLSAGTVVGPYRIEGVLGQGGMGVVYLARDERLDRPVALKLLPPHLRHDALARRRLTEEARAASALDHPNIATVYDVDVTTDGPSYIAMAYCEGPTLEERLAAGPLAEDEAVDLARQVGAALAAAHRQGVIHRDIKPANVILGPDGRARVVDFGIAKIKGSDFTEDGVTLGTVAYMSPEQTRPGPVGHRSDVWSLGVVLHEMLTGWRPFDAADDAAIIQAIRHDPAPEGAHPVVRRALEKDPADRYPTVDALLGDLAGEGMPGSRTAAGWRWPAAGLIAAAGALALALGPLRPNMSATGDAATRAGTGAAVAPARRLAILPPEHVAPDETDAYVAEGISEQLTLRLARLGDVRVIGRGSVRRDEVAAMTPSAIGAALGVDVVLAGSVRTRGERLHVTLRLVDPATEESVWSREYEGTRDEPLALEERIVNDVARVLELRLSEADKARLAARGTADDEAYLAHIRGRYYWNRRDREGLALAKREFELAVDRDPAYADAWAGLARTFILMAGRGIGPREDAYPRARQAAEQALAIDPDHAGALTALAGVQLLWYLDWEAAERNYRRALDADPDDGTAHYWYSEYLSFVGRPDEAIRHARTAQELEPLMPLAFADEARAHYMSRRFAEAIRIYEATLERGWEFTSLLFVPLAHSQLGDHGAAIRTMERFVEEVPRAHERYLAGYVFARAGRRAEADSVLTEALAAAEVSPVPAIVIAVVHIGLGDEDEAMRWLERSYENREWQLVFLPNEPLFDPLRNDPRFRRLLERVGP